MESTLQFLENRSGGDLRQTSPEARYLHARDSTTNLSDCLALQMYSDKALPGYIAADWPERDCRQKGLRHPDRYAAVSKQGVASMDIHQAMT